MYAKRLYKTINLCLLEFNPISFGRRERAHNVALRHELENSFIFEAIEKDSFCITFHGFLYFSSYKKLGFEP